MQENDFCPQDLEVEEGSIGKLLLHSGICSKGCHGHAGEQEDGMVTKYFYRSLYLPGKGMFCELPADLALGRIQVRKIPYAKSPGKHAALVTAPSC